MIDLDDNSRWAAAFTELAHDYWTEGRLDRLLKGKELPISPRTAPTLLRAVGLLHRDASMPDAQQRKFFQLNHMMRLLRPSLDELTERGEPLQIVDAGCGRSYLTLALAWWFRHELNASVRVLGVDRDEKLITQCRRRASMVGLTDVVRFSAVDLGTLDLNAVWRDAFGDALELDVVIALHACDTATDDAVLLGLAHDAELIAVAPCCQAELAHGWAQLAATGSSGAFAPIWSTPHLRREVGASLTDTFRKLLLEAVGFDVYVVEFVAAQHTPKNTLIRAMRRGRPDVAARQAYLRLCDETGGVEIKLSRILGVGSRE